MPRTASAKVDMASSTSSATVQNDPTSSSKHRSSFKIRNKQRRMEVYKKVKAQKNKEKMMTRKKAREEVKRTGEKVVKQVPKTIENMRVPDVTMVDDEDEEVMRDEAIDNFASYFNRESTPKILVTTTEKPHSRTRKFIRDLMLALPNASRIIRHECSLKKLVPQAVERGFTDIFVINEDMKQPNGLLIIHLPDGPTAHFKLSSVSLSREIKRAGKPTSSPPEVILNNFNTRLGHAVGRMLASLYPQDPEFQSRQVVTFHNQRDFIFFRFHRYRFKDKQKVGLQELGPRFTLKLRSLQLGTFDSKHGEYQWVHKRREMETSRRRFFL